MKLFTAAALLLSASTISGEVCGPKDSKLALGGSSTVSPLADVWAKDYSEQCEIDVVVNTGGSSEGARLACGVLSELTEDPDIGMMSRGFKAEEATVDGFTYTCVFGETGSTGVSVDVANDGVTVFAQEDGIAGYCLNLLAAKGGFKKKDLVKLFGNEMENDERPKWSDFDSGCKDEYVEIAIPDTTGGTYDFFKSVVFADGGAFRSGDGVYVGPEGSDDPVLDLVKEHPAAVTFIGYPDYAIETDKVAVPIEGVMPTLESISAGEYALLGRQIFMRVRASKSDEGVPFVMDGLLGPTPEGFVPLSNDQIYHQLEALLTLVHDHDH